MLRVISSCGMCIFKYKCGCPRGAGNISVKASKVPGPVNIVIIGNGKEL